MKAFLKPLAFAAMFMSVSAYAAPVEIQFWHSMEQKLGETVNEIADGFNKSQSDYKVIPVYKGQYTESMTAGIAAFRAGAAPHIIQVFEVGTATMMNAKKAIKPVSALAKETGVDIGLDDFIPTVAGYYSDDKGLVSMPFNSSSPVLYWNKDAFQKAGLDPETAPKTWQDVATYAAKLKESGARCGFTTSWPSWVLFENGAAWHGKPFATKNNGFDGLDAELEINTPFMLKHISFIVDNLAKKGLMTYSGRADEGNSRFYSGECAMGIMSAGSLSNIQDNAKFKFGVGYMPYHADEPGAPQNPVIGGASLWVMQGKPEADYKGVALFFKYIASPEIAAKWHQETGYLPVTKSAYKVTQDSGFYEKNPLAEVVVKQLQNKDPLPFTRGIRLGNLPQIRMVIGEEMEAVWQGSKDVKTALDTAKTRSDVLLRRFEKSAQ